MTYVLMMAILDHIYLLLVVAVLTACAAVLWQRPRRVLPLATVIAFDCRGCMGSDHQFMWIGEIVGTTMTRFAGEAYVIKVLKTADDPGDFRDNDMSKSVLADYMQRTCPIADSSLQEVRPGLFFLYE